MRYESKLMESLRPNVCDLSGFCPPLLNKTKFDSELESLKDLNPVGQERIMLGYLEEFGGDLSDHGADTGVFEEFLYS